ncbi:hypothetical protein [Kitasatospora sp. NPDC094016]|uniref:hypothetical protein n=1 Tax=Kitasatospora sp. NPDC094016 TaxID=3154986 RepID=UPI00331894D2
MTSTEFEAKILNVESEKIRALLVEAGAEPACTSLCVATVASGASLTVSERPGESGSGGGFVDVLLDEGLPDTEALAGMRAKSEEFAKQGSRVYLPLAD